MSNQRGHDLVAGVYQLIDPESARQLALSNGTMSIVVLDESGSMAKYGNAPTDAVNGYLRGLLDSPDPNQYFCAVVTFSDTMRVRIPLTLVTPDTRMTDYQPDGMTLLWGTVYQVLTSTLSWYRATPQIADRCPRVVIGVISDGDDNKSDQTRFPQAIREVVPQVLGLGWNLLTFGIGISGVRLAEEMGFPTDSSHAFDFAAAAASLDQTSIIMTETTLGGWKPR